MLKTTVWRVCVSVWCLNHTASKQYNSCRMKIISAGLIYVYSYKTFLSSDDHFLEKVQFSDEATFHVSGAVSRRNVRICGSENPHAYVEHQRDSTKVNVFCAISQSKSV